MHMLMSTQMCLGTHIWHCTSLCISVCASVFALMGFELMSGSTYVGTCSINIAREENNFVQSSRSVLQNNSAIL